MKEALLLRRRRLPELNPIAFRIPDPREFAVGGVVAFGVDADACLGQLGEKSVEIVNAEVDHGLLWALAEIFGIEREVGEDGHARRFGAVEAERSAALVRNGEVRRVPLGERLGVARLEEDAADADCFGHKNSSWVSGLRGRGSEIRDQRSVNSYQQCGVEGKHYLRMGGGRLTFFAEQIFESGLVFGLAAGARRVGQHARGFGLANALAGVGLDGFCGRKTGWLAFRHDKIEYGLSWAQAEVPKSSLDSILDSNLGSSTGTRGRSRNGKAE